MRVLPSRSASGERVARRLKRKRKSGSAKRSNSFHFLYVAFGGLFIKSPKKEPTDFEKLKEKLVSRMQSYREISGVADLQKGQDIKWYGVTSIGGTFGPLVGTLTLTGKLQGLAYAAQQSKVAVDLTEKFFFLVDGQLLLIGAECGSIERFRGVFLSGPSVRDKIKELIGEVVDFEIVGPTLAAIPLLISSLPRPRWLSQTESVFVKFQKRTSSQQALLEIYRQIGPRLSTFYELRYDSDQLSDLSNKIGGAQAKLLDMLVNLLNSGWYEFWIRLRIIVQIRRAIAELLRMLSLYGSDSNRLKNRVSNLEQQLLRSGAPIQFLQERIISEMFAKLNWKDHVRLAVVDGDSILNVVEHVRSEIQLTKNLSVTFWAALLGALVGAVVGFILTVLSGHL